MADFKKKISWFIIDNLIWFILFVTIIIFSSATPLYLTSRNILNILVHSSVLGVMVVGQSFPMITGNFDLSAESTLGLTALIGAWLTAPAGDPYFGGGLMLPPVLAVLVMAMIGLLIGWINSILINKLKMNNFIVTLAMLIIIRGLVLVWNEGETITGIPEGFLKLGGGSFYGIPLNITVMLLIFIIVFLILRYTQFGRDMYAVGGNRNAALASGINPEKVVQYVYMLSGLFAAIAAWMQVGRIGVATESLGEGMIFEVQAAAVIGGISLFGGRGNLIGALGGVLLLSSISSGLNLMRVSGFVIDAVRGLIIIFAMLIDAQKVRYKSGNGKKSIRIRDYIE